MHVPETAPVTYIDLLRHGLPEGGHRYRGRRDDPLSEEGWAQMWAAVGERGPWDRIVSSPMRRCAEFAHELAARDGLPLSLEPAFREISFGAWEGRRVAEVHAEEAEHLRRYWQDPVANPPPEGEPLPEFFARVSAAWDALVDGAEGEHLLLVAHGGVIRTILVHVLGMPLAGVLRFEVPNACLTRIRVQPDLDGQPLASLVFHGGRPDKP
jgi:alpha-ribazole phosphatase